MDEVSTSNVKLKFRGDQDADWTELIFNKEELCKHSDYFDALLNFHADSLPGSGDAFEVLTGVIESDLGPNTTETH